MRRRHFDALRPVCPVCRGQGRGDNPIELSTVMDASQEHVLEAILQCSNLACAREYPVLDGIPILLQDLRGFVQGHTLELLRRDDLSSPMESLLGDCCGPGTVYDTWRQHRSTYGCSHFGDRWQADDAEQSAQEAEPDLDVDGAVCQSFLDLLETALTSAAAVEASGPSPEGSENPNNGPWLDLGCAVGRGSLELARRRQGLVLGADLHFGMLRLAARWLRGERVHLPRRRSGVVYGRRTLQLEDSVDGLERVDFWLCDALALPFAEATFEGGLALNVLDCLASPYEGLKEMARVLQPGRPLAMSSPYDWSTGATPFEGWLGGHSDRGADGGDSSLRLRRLLAEPSVGLGLETMTEHLRQPWKLRLHERSVMEYQVDILALRRCGRPESAGLT